MPLAEWQRRTKQTSTTADDSQSQGQQQAKIIIKEAAAEGEESAKEPQKVDNDDILELLPKAYKSRAKVIVHYLKLDDQKRVTYANGDKSSHIIDLLKFVLSPISKTIPHDASAFYALLADLNVPKTVYVSRSLPVQKKFSWLSFK